MPSSNVSDSSSAHAHGLQYDEPAATWDEGFPLGNGIMGALVWGDGQPLNISLDRADLWDLRTIPEYQTPEYSYATMREWREAGRTDDLLRLFEEPYHRGDSPTKIPAGRLTLTLPTRFASGELDLANAEATVRTTDGANLRLFIHATLPMGVMEMTTAEPPPCTLNAPPFAQDDTDKEARGLSRYSVSELGYPASVVSEGDTWRAFTQQGHDGFSFAVYVAWRYVNNTWLSAWSVASSHEGADPLALAQARVDDVLTQNYAQSFIAHRAWWQAYWRQSSVRLPNPLIERQWYLEQYKFGAASRRGAPPITLQGPWTADEGFLPPWKGDYHHDLNTQLSYWPCYSGNHLEEGLSFLDWLWDTRDACVAWTKKFFDLPGMNVPMTADLRNRQMGGWCQYTHSATTAAWLSHHFYLHWRYSADHDFLRERAYPYIQDAAIFLEAITNERGADGLRTLPLSSSPEINDNKPDAWFASITNYDLALIRWLFGAAAELATELDRAEDEKRWRTILAELPELARANDGKLLVAQDYPLPKSHRHFSHIMALYPLDLIASTDGEEAVQTIRASLAELDHLGTDQWCGYSYSWLAGLLARTGNGTRAEQALDIFATAFCLRNSFHCNGDQSGKGYSNFTYRPFTLEGNFAAAAGIQEMLIQSHRGLLRIFPAIPDAWSDVAFDSLRAEGAFLISARREKGRTIWLRIVAEGDGACRFISPFSAKEFTLKFRSGEEITLTQDPA